MQTITGTRFGAIDYAAEDILTFPEGLIGLSKLTRFVLLSHSEDSHFRWLQSVDEPAMAFLTTDPSAYISNYSVEVDSAQAAELGITDSTPTLLLTTVSIPAGRPEDLTLNLHGPIVVNLESKTGKQLVVEISGAVVQAAPDGVAAA